MQFITTSTRLCATFATATIIAAAAATTLSAQVVQGNPNQGAQLGEALSLTSAARSSFLAAHPGAGLFELDTGTRDGSGSRITRVYGAAFSTGNNAVDSAEKFLRLHSGMLSSDFKQLMAIGPNGDGTHVLPVMFNEADGSYKFSLVGYTQHVNGVPVFRGDVRCLVRNEPGYPLVLVSNALRDVTDFAAAAGNTIRAIAPSKISLKNVSRLPLNQFGPGALISDQEQVIWAGYEEAIAATPRLAIKFIVTGTGVFDRSSHQRMLYIVDAATNAILFQEDQVLHADINVQVNGMGTLGTAADACLPEGSKVLPYAKLTYGATTAYANAAGAFTIPNGASELSVTSVVGGRWFTVNDSTNGTIGTIVTSSSGGALDFMHNSANTAEDQRAEVNAYIEANLVRDYLLTYAPAFPTIPTQVFAINVQVAGTCNAFYDGASINFYPSGGNCNNTAFSVVVHHDYGHHIVNRAGSGQGAYGEGFGDVMGVVVTDESRLAVGFQTCTTGIREANNSCQYSSTGCSSCGSEIHACGQLLSGCVWDLRDNFIISNPSTYRSLVSSLAINSVLLHTGTGIAADITIDFLTLDDNDGNIGNGSPHYGDINSAFTMHGLAGPPLQLISLTFPSGQPAYSLPNGGTDLYFNAGALSGTPAPNTGKLLYRVGASGSFTMIEATQVATNQYRVGIPAAVCGSTIQYYVAAEASSGFVVTNPPDAPMSFFSTVAAAGINTVFVDTVETNLGWVLTATGDTATSGLWTRGDPLGTFNGPVPVQPENDVTAAGVNCFFTGQGTGGALGQADVDGGFTSLTSPTLDASGGEAYASYSRWYSNNQGGAPNADTFRVMISNNNGTTWTTLETVGPAGAEATGGWINKEIKISSVIAPTATMKLRFIAEDAGTGSLIEAAVDEVRIKIIACGGNPLDLNGDGEVNAADLAVLLSNWGGAGIGDVNNSGTVDAGDLATLLGGWGG